MFEVCDADRKQGCAGRQLDDVQTTKSEPAHNGGTPILCACHTHAQSWAPKNFASGSEQFGSSKESEAGIFSRPTALLWGHTSPNESRRAQAVRLAKILKKLADQQSARIAVIEFALGATTYELPSSARVASGPERQRMTSHA